MTKCPCYAVMASFTSDFRNSGINEAQIPQIHTYINVPETLPKQKRLLVS